MQNIQAIATGRRIQLMNDNEMIHELINMEFNEEINDEDNLQFDFSDHYYSFDLQPQRRNKRLHQMN